MTPPPSTSLALQRLYHWERTAPDQVVFTQPMGGGLLKEFTWKDMVDETRRMAAFLQQQGFEPGSRIAILSKNCAWWMMADFAIWMAGFVSVPLYPTLAAGTISQILQHSESRLLFLGKLDDWEAMKPGVPAGLPCVSFAWAIDSGLKRISLGTRRRAHAQLPAAGPRGRTRRWPTWPQHGLLATGMHLFFAESLQTFARDLQRARPTTFFSVPRLWVKFQQGIHSRMPPQRLERLLKIPVAGRFLRKKILKALGLDACKYAAGGAAPMPPDLLRWYSMLGLDIIEVYGMTENCGVSHATLVDMRRPGTVGVPYDGVKARLDAETGEIQVKSGCLMLGYYKEPELSAAAFTADGWLHTGDKGVVEEDGCLRITGRVKDLFKTSKGKYVAPAPIEDKLVANPAVEACCVVGANYPQPFALLMLNEDAVAKSRNPAGRAALEDTMANHLLTVNHGLDPHEQLEVLILMTEPWTVENGLITPTFKIKRNVLETRYAAGFDKWTSSGEQVVWAD